MNVFCYNTLDLVDAMFISDSTQGADVASNSAAAPGSRLPANGLSPSQCPAFTQSLGPTPMLVIPRF